jgi:plasmid stability protein
MATLTIRDLDDAVKAQLRIQAAQNGRSMEAEAREILATALRRTRSERGLGTRIHELFADIGGAPELAQPDRREPVRVIDFSE